MAPDSPDGRIRFMRYSAGGPVERDRPATVAIADIREFFVAAAIAIPGDTEDFFELGYLNSLRALELVDFVEHRFAITVEADDLRLDNFRTMARIADFVRRKKTQPSTAGHS
jgi:methoxymalonate biosynthesis acyl carrier protein